MAELDLAASGVASEVVAADEAADTTSYPTFVTDPTGDLPVKTDAAKLTYNASTGALGSTSFVGDLTGDVTGNATNLSGTPDLPDGTTATTQSASDNSTNVATTAYADASGGLTKYDATVGSAGADYADIQAAITGVGGTDIKLLLITDVTEDSDIVVGGLNLLIDLSSYKLTMAGFAFTYASAGNVYVRGNGVGSGAEIDYTHTGLVPLFNNTSYATSIVNIRDVVIDNNSSSRLTPVGRAIDQIENVRMECANYDTTGFMGPVDDSYYRNIQLVGGGGGCWKALITTNGVRIVVDGLSITGTWTSTASEEITQFNTGCVASNINAEVDTNANLMRLGGGSLTGMTTQGQDINLLVLADSVKIQNIDLLGGDITFSNDYAYLVNVKTTGDLIFNDSSVNNFLFTNVRCETAVTVDGDRHKFSNCDFIGGASVVSGANNNIFTGNQFGADAGGGAATLTIDATSTGTIAIGNQSDVAIVDNGTSSAVANNVVY